MSVPEKIDFESDFQHIATGGKISYNEFNYGVPLDVLEEAVNFAMDKGLYYGVNVISSTCNNCGHSGDFQDSCSQCGESENIITVSRVCGYLSFQNIKGESRFNPGKQQEIKDRVKHSYGISLE